MEHGRPTDCWRTLAIHCTCPSCARVQRSAPALRRPARRTRVVDDARPRLTRHQRTRAERTRARMPATMLGRRLVQHQDAAQWLDAAGQVGHQAARDELRSVSLQEPSCQRRASAGLRQAGRAQHRRAERLRRRRQPGPQRPPHPVDGGEGLRTEEGDEEGEAEAGRAGYQVRRRRVLTAQVLTGPGRF